MSYQDTKAATGRDRRSEEPESMPKRVVIDREVPSSARRTPDLIGCNYKTVDEIRKIRRDGTPQIQGAMLTDKTSTNRCLHPHSRGVAGDHPVWLVMKLRNRALRLTRIKSPITGYQAMKIHHLILTTAFLLMLAGNTYAASFDCGKAASEVEKLICSDAELSRLDEVLSAAFRKALKCTNIKEQMVARQRQWLKNERNACEDAECLKNAYETRIRGLRLMLSGARYQLLMDYPTGVHTGMFWVDPSNIDVCSAYEENLNSFSEIKYPMRCERPINPALKEFRRLEWTDLNASEHRETILTIDKRSPIYRAHPSALEKWNEQFNKRVAGRWIRLRLAKIEVTEINGEPLDAPLYLLEYGAGRECNGYQYCITDQHMNNVVGVKGYSLSDPFVYMNRVYFTSFADRDWSDSFKHRLESTQYEVWLYELVRIRPYDHFSAVPICRFIYIGKLPVIPGKEDQ